MVSEEIQQQLNDARDRADEDALLKIFEENADLDVNHAFQTDGSTALHVAAMRGWPKSVEYYIAREANLSFTDARGLNAAHTVCASYIDDRAGSLRCLQLLLEKDHSLLNVQTLASRVTPDIGQTCLHLATDRGKLDIVNWLLDKGADTTIKTEEGETAWDMAIYSLRRLASRSTSMPVEREATMDVLCTFVQREARLSNYPEEFGHVFVRRIRGSELYRPRILSRMSIFLLLEHLSRRDVLKQSCQQIRRELCQFISTSNERRCREPSCSFEIHNHHYRGDRGIEAVGVGKDRFYADYKDILPSDSPVLAKAHTASSPYSPNANAVDLFLPDSLRTDSMLSNAMMRSPGPNYLSIVMPIIFSMYRSDFNRSRSTRQESAKNLFKNSLYCRSSIGDEIEFHGALTLDEYCYPALSDVFLNRRNEDQTLTRTFGDEWSEHRLSGLVLIDQAWVWQAQNTLIFGRLGLGDYLQKYPVTSQSDALLTSYGQVGVYLADLLDSAEPDFILDRFQDCLAILTEEVNEYSTQTGVEFIDIDKEKKFFHEINDVREELSMIRRVLSQQEEVWRDFASTAWPEIWADVLNGRINQQFPVTQNDAEKEDRKEITKLIMRPRRQIQKRQRRIAQLDEDAERVERSVSIQLDVKKQHTSIQEAHATAIISAAAFGFAVITIIFTPLSFVMSLFALPIDRFQDCQIPSRWSSDAGMYSTSYIGTWTATTEIVSVALTIAATWLALEYGLKYRITKKTWLYLLSIPYSLGFVYEYLKRKLSHRWSLSRKQNKEKDEESPETIERRRSVHSRVSMASGASRTSRVSRISRMSRASSAKKTSSEAGQGKQQV